MIKWWKICWYRTNGGKIIGKYLRCTRTGVFLSVHLISEFIPPQGERLSFPSVQILNSSIYTHRPLILVHLFNCFFNQYLISQTHGSISLNLGIANLLKKTCWNLNRPEEGKKCDSNDCLVYQDRIIFWKCYWERHPLLLYCIAIFIFVFIFIFMWEWWNGLKRNGRQQQFITQTTICYNSEALMSAKYWELTHRPTKTGQLKY